MMVSDAEIDANNITHKGNIVQDVLDGLHRLIADTQKSLGTARNWTQLQLTDGEQLKPDDVAKQLGRKMHNYGDYQSFGEFIIEFTNAHLSDISSRVFVMEHGRKLRSEKKDQT